MNKDKYQELINNKNGFEVLAVVDGSSSNASLVSPSLNEEFNKKSRVYILKR
jgi:ethanolamine utilization protein EutP (predicted NTPase)